MRRITWVIALVLAAGVLAAAGCGDDDDSGSGGSGGGTGTEESSGGGGGGGETLTVTADPGGAISWDKTELSAKAGSVTLKLVNESDIPHAIEIEGNGVEEETDTVTAANAEVDRRPRGRNVRVLLPGRPARGDDEGHAHGRVTVSVPSSSCAGASTASRSRCVRPTMSITSGTRSSGSRIVCMRMPFA